MSALAGSLRLRLFAGTVGAGLFTSALLAIAVLLEIRDSLYSRRIADAREALHAELRDAEGACGADAACWRARFSRREGAGYSLRPGPCAASQLRAGSMASLCAELSGDAAQLGAPGSLHLAVPLEPVREQLRQLDARLLLWLGLALAGTVMLVLALFERGVIRRLAPASEALGALDAQGDRPLLPEGADALGQLGGAINRLAQRLAEERARTQAQIVSLQAANRALGAANRALDDERQAVASARADLLRSERLASAGRLAAGVAHEVGNPLSAVIACAALLRERLAALEGQGESLELAARIEREAARVDRILRDLLDLARPSQPRLEPISLQHALDTACALVRPQPLFETCALDCALPPGLPRALGEEHYVVQVLVNLLTNAAKAGAQKIEARAEVFGEALSLELRDDGSGIPPEILPRLFEPFVTSAAPGQGTGLGLALSHATMERLGGSIAARANPPRGAIFTLRFRRAPND